MRICAISQSNYIPWKGYFHLIGSVDVFIFYDTADYTKRDWRTRNKIMTPSGPQWMTIPAGSNKGKSIDAVVLPDGEWRRNHLETIRRNYSRCPHIHDVMELLTPIYEDESITHLSTFNQQLIRRIAEYLDIETELRNASEFNVSSDRVGRLIAMCEMVGADAYLSGPAAKDYITDEFDEIPIELKWMEYGPYDEYPQRSEPFSHYVSIIDTIAMIGKSTKQHIFG